MDALQVLVIGSSNADFTTYVKEIPVAGQTTFGTDFQYCGGGKGANQAVQAAKLSLPNQVAFVTCLGHDHHGDFLEEQLKVAGVNMTLSKKVSHSPTGVATIIVEESGENRIIVVPGANSKLLPSTLDDTPITQAISKTRVVILQMEIPHETVFKALRMAHSLGRFTILNPAPARVALSPEVLKTIDLLTPNEGEALAISGKKSIDEALKYLTQYTNVVITLGKKGCVFVPCEIAEKCLTQENGECKASYVVEKDQVKDTTGAGDSFNAALAVFLSNKMINGQTKLSKEEMEEFLRDSCYVAAMSVTRKGTQTSYYSLDELPELKDKRKCRSP